MTSLKITKMLRVALFGVGVLTITAVVAAYWWSNIEPRRPLTVARDAVWIWAPHNQLPSPKHGMWARCWPAKPSTDFRCKIWNESGQEIFEGVFLPYVKQPVAVAASIDTKRTGSLSASIRGVSVPVVYLRDGQILIPADAYAEVVR